MSKSHMRIQNVIIFKRYVMDLLFNADILTVVYTGERRESFKLESVPTQAQITGYALELEDRP